MVQDKKLNMDFTAGEECLLEQACMILERRSKDFVSKHFEYNKKLTLIENDR